MALILKSKKQAQMLKDAQRSSGLPYYKPEYSKESGWAFVFICPPKNEDSLIVTKVASHSAFAKGQKLADDLVSPSNFGEVDDITKLGFDIKKKYADSENKSLKAMYQYFIAKDKNIIFVIDPKNPKKGIQQWAAPYAVAQFLMVQIEGDGEGTEAGDMSFAHPTEGKLLKFKRTGKDLNTKYTVEWAKKKPDLGEIDEDKLVEMLAALPNVIGGLFKKPSKEAIQKYKDFLDEYASKKGATLNWKNTKNSKLNDEAEEDDDTSTDVAGVEDEDLDLDSEAEEKAIADKKKAKAEKAKADAKKKPKKDDDEDEDAEDDIEKEDSDADDEDDIEVDLDDEDSED